MNNHNLIAIDLAKDVFQVCIMSASNRVLMNKSFHRKALSEFMVKQQMGYVADEQIFVVSNLYYKDRPCRCSNC